MKNPKVTIVDYGCGNILSVRRALEHCGAEVELATDSQSIEQSDRLLLPGVGAFGNAMQCLYKLRLIEAIYAYAESKRPLLGICLGAQILFEYSEEFGRHQGLSLIPGEVVAIPSSGIDGTAHKIPHIGWNALYPSHENTAWGSTLLKDTPVGSSTYFVHSYHATVTHRTHQLAYCLYNGIPITAVVRHENITGCQFHPEKSGPVGLTILKNFLSA